MEIRMNGHYNRFSQFQVLYGKKKPVYRLIKIVKMDDQTGITRVYYAANRISIFYIVTITVKKQRK